IGNILTLQDDNYIEITIPGRNLTKEFRGTYVEFDTIGNYSWTGELMTNGIPASWDTTSTEYGYLTILRREERVFGEIKLDTISYQIRDLTDSLNALIEIGEGQFAETCAMVDSTGSGIQNSSSNTDFETRSTTVCPVSILVLYTEAAAEENPDIDDVAELAFFNTHQTLRVSHVSAMDLRFMLKGIVGITNEEWEESEDLEFDRLDVALDDEIIDYRIEYNADIVVVLTASVYDEGGGAVTAIGETEENDVDAYAIVEAAGANERFYAFAHEVFHLFGCRHETEDLCPSIFDNTETIAHGYIVKKKPFLAPQPTYYHTVMAVCLKDMAPNQVNQTMHISNPEVKFKRKATGKDGTHFNVLQLRQEACRVSNYVVTEFPYVAIGGPFEICPNDAAYVYAIIYGSSAPYAYSWRISNDGVNYGDPIVTQYGQLVIDVPDDVGGVIYVQLTAGNSSGPMSTATHAINIVDDEDICIRNPTSVENDLISGSSIVVSPNPSQNSLTVQIDVNNKSNCAGILNLVSCYGQTVRTILVTENVAVISDIYPGCYFITFADSNNTLLMSSNCLIIID
ncbi:MAG TPA: zinc-dependent metalloprotease family protein, partial [Saprospiraceae bacterium]|nr:zinc-dependent metalloprotease family protein [Saprospiraceae bacterium]